MSKFVKLSLTLFFLILCFSLSSCHKVKKENNTTVNNQPKKQYYINYKLFLPHEIYVNDVKIINNKSFGPVSGMEYLNETILNSGIQSVRLVTKDLKLDSNIPEDLFKKMKMEIYAADENEENIEKIKIFEFPDTKTPKPFFFENTWTFNAEVPFNLESWKNGKDLKKVDEKELESLVVDKFDHYRNLLNQGNVDQFMKENGKNYEEFIIANYYQKDWAEYEQNIRETFDNQKGCMLPLEDYTMKIYGKGKLVTLERVSPVHYGESALLAISNNNDTVYVNYLYLYMSPETNELEPIRLYVIYSPKNKYE